MILLGLVYTLGALIFFFFPADFARLAALAGRIIRLDLMILPPGDAFYTMIAAVCLAMQACLCFLSAESPKTPGYALTHLLAKVVGATGFGYVYFNGDRQVFHLLMSAGETLIGAISLWVHLRIPRQMPVSGTAQA